GKHDSAKGDEELEGIAVDLVAEVTVGDASLRLELNVAPGLPPALVNFVPGSVGESGDVGRSVDGSVEIVNNVLGVGQRG
ncbi:hypothetical protein LTR74_019005, partial [Friedmanniomyces endolithicus]